MSARDRRCVIEVVNTGGREWPCGAAFADDPAAATAEHGRGLKIIDQVADNLQLTSTDYQGTTVHFEKELEWLPGAAGLHLFNGHGIG